jgi:hypothetical protein
MKKYFPLIALFLSLMVIVSCNREDAPDCIQSGGTESSEYRELAPFSRIELRDYIHYELIQADKYSVEIRGPGNLLNDITTEVRDGKLLVSNANTCNFVRSFRRKIYVRIAAPTFGEIEHYASGNVSALDTIRQSRFVMNFRHATGEVNLLMHCDTVSLFMHTGSADCNVSGEAETTELFANGLGFLDAYSLTSRNLFVNHSSIQPLKASVSDYLFCLIGSRGDVILNRAPSTMDIQDEGLGNLVFLD